MIVRTPYERAMDEIGLIALRHGITRDDILSRKKSRHIVEARNHCFWHFRQSGKSYPQIGRFFNRDHTTVLHGVRKFIDEQGS